MGLKVIGHRGARRLAVENSLESLRLALHEGADGIEFDVQRTADGELVLFHDEDLQRLCGRPGAIRQLPWRDVRSLVVRDKGLRDQPIAHLDQLLDLVVGGKWLVNAELKLGGGRDDGLALAETFARRVRDLDLGQWIVSSFARLPLRRLAEGGLPVPLGALIDRAPCDWQDLRLAPKPTLEPQPLTVEFPLASVHPQVDLVDEARMARWRTAGWQVHVWTVNHPRQWEALAGLRVDGVITDDPLALLAWIDRNLRS